MNVACETCHKVLDRDNAHDWWDEDGDGELHYWCAEHCPVCDILNDDDLDAIIDGSRS